MSTEVVCLLHDSRGGTKVGLFPGRKESVRPFFRALEISRLSGSPVPRRIAKRMGRSVVRCHAEKRAGRGRVSARRSTLTLNIRPGGASDVTGANPRRDDDGQDYPTTRKPLDRPRPQPPS